MSELRVYERGFEERRIADAIRRAENNAEKRTRCGDLEGAASWKAEAVSLRAELAELERV